MNSNYKSVARMIEYTLTWGTEESTHLLSALLMMRLSDHDRSVLAFAALGALEEPEACDVANAVILGSVERDPHNE
jgi:hypothetical protein